MIDPVGDFLYSELELQATEEDIKVLLGEGANGLVFRLSPPKDRSTKFPVTD